MKLIEEIRSLSDRAQSVLEDSNDLEALSNRELAASSLTKGFLDALVQDFGEETGAGELDVGSVGEEIPEVDLTVRRGNTPLMLVRQTEGGSPGEPLPDRGAERLLQAIGGVEGARFGILTDGVRYEFFSGLKTTISDCFYDFDLLNWDAGEEGASEEGADGIGHSEVEKARAAFASVIRLDAMTSGQGQPSGEASADEIITSGSPGGLFYIYAVERGKPLEKTETAVKFGVTGRSPSKRRREHERRLGIGDSERLVLCYLARGPAVLAERIVARRTAPDSPPGLGPRSEWRLCTLAQLVGVVEKAVRDQTTVLDNLGAELDHEVLWDPCSLASGPAPGQGSSKELSSEEISPEEENPTGEEAPGQEARCTSGAALSRAKKVKAAALAGNLGTREEKDSTSFRVSEKEKRLLEECVRHSRHADVSTYVRDLSIGWSRSAPIIAKVGLILHWIRAFWGERVGKNRDRLWDLTKAFFNPALLAEESFSEKMLRKILRLVTSHLLALRPRPLQLLVEQRARLNGWDELGTGDGLKEIGILPDVSLPELEQKGELRRAQELREKALGVPTWTEGMRETLSVRFADAEREALRKNLEGSSFASISSYVKSVALGWDRDARAVGWAAVIVDWLAGRVGEGIEQPDWQHLRKVLRGTFDPGAIARVDTGHGGTAHGDASADGDDSEKNAPEGEQRHDGKQGQTLRATRAVEEHLLEAPVKRIAEVTGIG